MLDWDKVSRKEEKPPFVPQLKSPYDTQYFYPYPDEAEVDRKMRERANGIVNDNPMVKPEPPGMFDNF